MDGSDMGGLSSHAWERVKARLEANGIDAEPLVRLAMAVARANRHRDVAMRLIRLPEAVGDTTSPLMERRSNGTDLWAIARRGVIETLMWRRPEQPPTPEAMRVDQVFLKPSKAVKK